jgi:uncharacterized protein (TIGR03067 family)
MRAAIVFGVSLGMWLSAGPAQAQAQETGQEDQLIGVQMIGTYKLVSGSNGGKDIPKDQLAGGRVQIGRTVMTTFDAENKEVYVVRYKVERDEEPARIGMVVTSSSRPDSVGMKARGLVKVEGRKLTLIYDYKGEDFPSDFEPKGDTQNRFVMERIPETK